MPNDNPVSIPWSSHEKMVEELFVVFPTFALDILHAAVGISDEVGEVIECNDRDELKKELGDVEFYLRAAKQAIERAYGQQSWGDRSSLGLSALGYNAVDLTVSAAKLLGIVKKLWVNGKNVPVMDFLNHINSIELDLDDIYRLHGFTAHEIQFGNMVKLAKRYPSGKWSSAEAIAQADKGVAHG